MKSFLLTLCLLSLTSVAYCQEAVDLTTPYQPVAPVTAQTIAMLHLDWENERIVIVLGKEELTITDPGKNGTLTTRTNATSGSLTMTTGHGIVTGQRIGLAWTGGQRVNVLVGTVAGDVVPFSGGNGTVLPAAATAITTPTIKRKFTEGTKREFSYQGDEALNLLRILNTANLSTASLHKRVINKLIADGKLSGTVSGTPE